MTTDTTTEAIIEQNGKLIGPYRRPRNLAQNQRGSIHDDATATKLGFRGGTVAGSIHMEQFPPILVRAFGDVWWERGSLSCYFRNATIDNEAVRPICEIPASRADGAQIKVWMERDDGMQVLEGSAALGEPSEPSMLRRKLSEPREAGELRILADLAVDRDLPPVRTRMSDAIAAPRLHVITEPLAIYEGPSRWGGAVVNPGLLVHMMVQAQPQMGLPGGAVGLYGAIEIRHINGPVLADRDYDVTPRVLAVGSTPKTEYLWFETRMTAPDSGEAIAEMLMMLRFMKASSKRWADA